MDWREGFKNCCLKMKETGTVKKTLSDRGVIEWQPVRECGACKGTGLFTAHDIDYGEFFECACATYCPACGRAEFSPGINFAPYDQERFLPIMKKKLIQDPSLAEILKLEEGTCPVCGGVTYIYCKDLGGLDYYDNWWESCASPDCDWPGSHREEYEQGPY